jgi:hypothetical protein
LKFCGFVLHVYLWRFKDLFFLYRVSAVVVYKN